MLLLNQPHLNESTVPEGTAVPTYDLAATVQHTHDAPTWLHIGPGNIFRGYIAEIQDDLLQSGDADTGIIALSTSDPEKLAILRDKWAMRTLQVTQSAQSTSQRIIASVTEGLAAAEPDDWQRAKAVAKNPSLQMISFTITEKGYRLKGIDGEYTDTAAADLGNTPDHPTHAMAITTALLLVRFNANQAPIALVSMDNFTHNGTALKQAVLTVAEHWETHGHVDKDFITWLNDSDKVAFPLTVIDRIVPRATPELGATLEAQGFANLGPVITQKGQDIAGYVNTEEAHYLLIEDHFPNGRPPLEKAGVIMTDATTVDRFEGMKVTTCLNPLHTALAVAGSLLNIPTIAACMDDPDLVHLLELIGTQEGLTVVEDPKVIDPKDFLNQVLTERLPNPHTGDTPKRIATDTSQKVGIRFGETIKKYRGRPDLDPKNLIGIPFTLALWLRYLLAVDDTGKPFTPSPDPLLEPLQAALEGITLGTTDRARVTEALTPILANADLFHVDLTAVGLDAPIIDAFLDLIQGSGHVRAALTQLRQ